MPWKKANTMKRILERDIEKYLVAQVKKLGGEVRKVQWLGRSKAPDRVVMLPRGVAAIWHNWTCTLWVEVKNPETIRTFPANAHERAQYREHEEMRRMGQRVEVVGTYEQVDGLFT